MVKKIILGIALCFAIFLILLVSGVYATQINITNQTDFNSGTYSDVFYNATSNAVQLNISEGKISGNYTSKVFDAGGINMKWNNVSWLSDTIGELPSNGLIETSPAGINMTGNVLLFHLNNDSVYGENSTRIYDFSGVGNNGTPIDNAAFGASNKKLGAGGYEFDGSGDYINLSLTSSLDLVGNYTICVWIYPKKLGTKDVIIKRGSGSSNLDRAQQYNFYYSSTGKLSFAAGDGGAGSDISSTNDGQIVVNMWSFVCAQVNESNQMNIYKNGTDVTTTRVTKTRSTTATFSAIGTGLSASQPFNGTIDEVAIWNRSLSSAEILNVYQRGIFHFNVTVRSCDDINCSGEVWNETYTSSPANLSVANNSFFQYRANFLTDDGLYSPEFYNLTIDFSGTADLPNFTSRELSGRPTNSSVVVNLIDGNNTIDVYLEYGNESADAGGYTNATSVLAGVENDSLIEISLSNLEPDMKYYYRVRAKRSSAILYGYSDERTFRTKRSSFPFNFTMISDSHIELNPGLADPDSILKAIVGNASLNDNSDFMISLGDEIVPGTAVPGTFANESEANQLYQRFRNDISLGNNLPPLFYAIGNWEGESGWFDSNSVALAKNVRKKYIPNPTNETYSQNGSADEDYYAFDWGNALFVVINVMGYTTTDHPYYANSIPQNGTQDNWALGATQLNWLNQTLRNSQQPWKFILAHHTVSGNGSTDYESIYGRGGGRAAFVGEQATVHQMMLENNVSVFFIGHDHVFVDLGVDNIHYIDVGRSGHDRSFCNTGGYNLVSSNCNGNSGRTRVEIQSNELAKIVYINDSEAVVKNYTLDRLSPRVLISESINATQLNNRNITISYNVSDASAIINCSLILNGAINQTNSTITKDLMINFTLTNLPIGNNNYSVSCLENASNGVTTYLSGAIGNTGNSTVRTLGIISSTGFAGRSTNLSAVTNFSNVSHLVFHQPDYGLINFTQDVDLSGGGNLDTYVNITQNRIEINTTALLSLNKSAILTLYNLTFTNPRVLKDGAVCSDCVEVSYSGGNFIFNVVSFSVYTAEETPSVLENSAVDSGSSGGIPSFTVSEVDLEKGYEKQMREGFKITFSINDEKHILLMKKVLKDEAAITISSEPIALTLKVNETRKLDLDNNGFYDLEVSLKEIKGYFAKIGLKTISEKIIGEEVPEKEEIVFEEEKATPENVENKSIFFSVSVGVLVIIVAIFCLVLIFRHKKRRRLLRGY